MSLWSEWALSGGLWAGVGWGLALGLFTVQMEYASTVALIILFMPGVTTIATYQLYRLPPQ